MWYILNRITSSIISNKKIINLFTHLSNLFTPGLISKSNQFSHITLEVHEPFSLQMCCLAICLLYLASNLCWWNFANYSFIHSCMHASNDSWSKQKNHFCAKISNILSVILCMVCDKNSYYFYCDVC